MDDVTLHMLELKGKGFCCSQIILILALENQGRTNPDLVRAAQALCFGVSLSGEVCGALSGAACLISLCAGKGSDAEDAHESFPSMMNELSEWFREKMAESYGGIRCDDILSIRPDKSACGPIVAETYGKAMEILMNHGLDPAIGK